MLHTLHTKAHHPHTVLITLLLGVGLFCGVIFYNAWVVEDAYISFRVVDNAVNGYGLRWNVDERVQVFTNPLWTLLHIPLYYITGEEFYTGIGVSMFFSCAAFLILATLIFRKPLLFFTILVLPLILSKAFREYAISGLENPFTFFMIALCVMKVVEQKKQWPWLPMVLIATFAALNRLDTILLFIPLLAFHCIKDIKSLPYAKLFIRVMPLIAWFLFSLLYYGFLFPNTKYAKLNTGFSQHVYIEQGVRYGLHLLHNDPLTASVILLGLLFTLYQTIKALRQKDLLTYNIAALGWGGVLYSAYVIYIGGDFMSGRFWSTVFFLYIALFAVSGYTLSDRLRPKYIAMFTGMLLLTFFLRDITKYQEITTEHHISDERAFYDHHLALFSKEPMLMRADGWSQKGIEHANTAQKLRDTGKTFVAIEGSVGRMGYFAGPEVVFVDWLAITDPLLARLPANMAEFRIGHLAREIPEGYIHARETGDLGKMHPALQEYYQALRSITTDPVFASQRLETLLRFHLGQYDHLKHAYLASKTTP